MNSNFDDIQKEIKIINKAYIDLFEEKLTKENLVSKTIDKHVDNVDFYLNFFLLFYEPLKMEDGITHIANFYDFFFQKCYWASKNSLKDMIASLKKFYKCMNQEGYITDDALDSFNKIVKEEMKYWIKDNNEENEDYSGEE